MGDAAPGGAVVASAPGGAVVASAPGGAVVASTPGGAVVASAPGGAVVASAPGGTVAAPPPSEAVVAPAPNGTTATTASATGTSAAATATTAAAAADNPLSTNTRDSKGNMKWMGLKGHMEKLLKEKPDSLEPGTGYQEFKTRVRSGLLAPGFIIYMARSWEDTKGGAKVESVDPLGWLTGFIQDKIVERKYIFSHVAIYVGEWEGVHYFVENGGPKTGKKFLSKKNSKKYHSAIQLMPAKGVLGKSPFIALTVPWGKLFVTDYGKKQKLWPNREELVQKALASVGFPFNYDIRTRSCETFTMLLLGVGEIDAKEVFPQLQIVLEDAPWYSKKIAGSKEITEKDIEEFEKFQKDFKVWFSERSEHVDMCEFEVVGGKVIGYPD